MSLSYLETYEQMFPIQAKDGEIWVYSKINFQKPDKEGYRNMTGFLQYIDRPIDTTNENIDFFQVSNLLYQQTNISYSLLAFLLCDDVTQVVNKTLGDLLNQFLGDRIYVDKQIVDKLILRIIESSNLCSKIDNPISPGVHILAYFREIIINGEIDIFFRS